MKWENKNGIATYGYLEVRVTERLANHRPVRWAVFEARADGTRHRLTADNMDHSSFSAAKTAAEILASK